jgi:20S proteasome subunit beta 2
MGSGSLAAIAVFEAKYKDDLNLEEGRNLVIEAIEAGINHDLGYLN